MADVGRLFLAVPLTGEVRSALAAHIVGSLEGRALPGKPVPPPNWHLTMRFFGPTDEVTYDRLLAALTEAELGSPFSATLAGLGAFPRPARATVLWQGIAGGADRLEDLADVSEEAARLAGFAPEDRPFHPHVTLSRIRPHQDVRSLIERVRPLGMSLPVDRLVVYRSHLGRGGARYEELDNVPLA